MTTPVITRLAQLDEVWRLEADTVGYLIVRQGKALLVDCPSTDAAAALTAAGLPAPEVILHTQVQEEHCREWAAFPAAKVYVAEAAIDVATRSPRFFSEAKTVWPPSRDWTTGGEEKYGVAGAVTERPPLQGLNVAGGLTPGATFRWQNVELEILALPGSGKRSIGFFWPQADCCFTGDLLYAGGYLVNIYDQERNYGGLEGWRQSAASIASVQARKPRLALPSTGPIIADFAAAAARLLPLLANPCRVPTRRVGEPTATINYTPRRILSERWREVVPGLFQNTSFGNMILYIEPAGHALLVDPDFCVWKSWEENCQALHDDFDMLEREAGLKTIDRILLTHYHGDHVQYADELRRRYGATVCGTPEVTALVEHPERYNYVALVNWYNFPFPSFKVDERLVYDREYRWADTTFTPIHSPGHCFAHAGYIIGWQGLRTYCASDVIQYGSGPIGAGLPVAYNDTAWPDFAAAVTLRRLVALKPDLVLGGHSHSFFDRDGSILRDMLGAAETAVLNARDLIHDGNLRRAMTPPGFDAIRPSLT